MAVTPFDLPSPKTPCCTQTVCLSYCGTGMGTSDLVFVHVTLTLIRWPSHTNLTRIPWSIRDVRKWTFYIRAFESDITVSYCVHLVRCGSLPVTWQKWRSHHSIWQSKTSRCMQTSWLLCFIVPQSLPIEVLHCVNRDFGPFFAPVTLTLTRWPSYTNFTCIPRNTPDVRKWTSYVKASKVIVRQTDRQINRQTDRHNRNYTPCRFAGDQ